MKPQPMTLNTIRQLGIEALLSTPGPVGMIRFLHQFETGHGNYAVDRHQWLTVKDVETLVQQIQQARQAEKDDAAGKTILAELQAKGEKP